MKCIYFIISVIISTFVHSFIAANTGQCFSKGLKGTPVYRNRSDGKYRNNTYQYGNTTIRLPKYRRPRLSLTKLLNSLTHVEQIPLEELLERVKTMNTQHYKDHRELFLHICRWCYFNNVEFRSSVLFPEIRARVLDNRVLFGRDASRVLYSLLRLPRAYKCDYIGAIDFYNKYISGGRQSDVSLSKAVDICRAADISLLVIRLNHLLSNLGLYEGEFSGRSLSIVLDVFNRLKRNMGLIFHLKFVEPSGIKPWSPLGLFFRRLAPRHLESLMKVLSSSVRDVELEPDFIEITKYAARDRNILNYTRRLSRVIVRVFLNVYRFFTQKCQNENTLSNDHTELLLELYHLRFKSLKNSTGDHRVSDAFIDLIKLVKLLPGIPNHQLQLFRLPLRQYMTFLQEYWRHDDAYQKLRNITEELFMDTTGAPSVDPHLAFMLRKYKLHTAAKFVDGDSSPEEGAPAEEAKFYALISGVGILFLYDIYGDVIVKCRDVFDMDAFNYGVDVYKNVPLSCHLVLNARVTEPLRLVEEHREDIKRRLRSKFNNIIINKEMTIHIPDLVCDGDQLPFHPGNIKYGKIIKHPTYDHLSMTLFEE